MFVAAPPSKAESFDAFRKVFHYCETPRSYVLQYLPNINEQQALDEKSVFLFCSRAVKVYVDDEMSIDLKRKIEIGKQLHLVDKHDQVRV